MTDPDSKSLAGPSTPGPSATIGSACSYSYYEPDLETAEPVLYTEEQPEQPNTPWPARFTRRAKRRLQVLPGVARSARVLRAILGPTREEAQLEDRSKPATSLAWSVTGPCGGRGPVAIDSYPTRVTKKFGLDYLWLPYLLVWIMAFILLIRAYYYQPGSPEMIPCTAALWDDWPPDACGLNGTECRRFLDAGTYRCPAGCQRVNLGNPRYVGATKVNGVPKLVGGGDDARTYRADSWVCAAGVQSGVVSPTYGGCLRIKPLPFPAGASDFKGFRGSGLRSLSFGPSFPAAYTVSSAPGATNCMDLHWPITAFNVVALFLFTTFFAPPPVVLATTLLLLGYAHVVLVSDPPYQPPSWSRVFGGILPLLLAGYWAWNVSLRRTLHGFFSASMPLETAIWQGFGFWIGIESSTLFSRIPISRLGYGALGANGIAALVIIIILVTIVVLIQAVEMRRRGLLRFYLVRYIPLVPILIILANLGHGYYLRLHHYMIALAGLPVLSLENRISLFGQAFCLAWFCDGVGRWGWASIVQGGTELVGDAVLGTEEPVLATMGSVVSWLAPGANSTLVEAGISAVSVLLDDVLVRSNYTGNNFSLTDTAVNLAIDHYFRLAYVGNGTSMDFTKPLTWHASNQSWDSPLS